MLQKAHGSSCDCSFTEITAQQLLYKYQLESFKVFEKTLVLSHLYLFFFLNKVLLLTNYLLKLKLHIDLRSI